MRRLFSRGAVCVAVALVALAVSGTSFSISSALAASVYYDAPNDRIVYSSTLQLPGAYATGNVGINVTGTTALDLSGALNMVGISAPSLSASGQGTIYFDSTANTFKVSQNGGAYANLVSSGGITGSGTTSYIPKFTGTSAIGNSIIFDNGTNIGIGTDSPGTFKLQVAGDIGPNAAPTIGSVSQTTTAVDTANDVGWFTSIAIGADGFPVISHFDLTNFDLRVVKCGNAACSSGNTTTAVDTTNDVGRYPSIAIGADGLPVIAHYDNTNGDLRVTKCGNSACSSGNTSTAVDTANNVGNYSSIAIGTDGLPVISHQDVTNGDLRVTKCSTASCSSSSTTAVDTTNDVGYETSIAIGTDGLPVISHWDITNLDLRVVKCGNAACSSGNTATAVDTANNVGNYSSIAIGADGLPVISYRDETNGDLRVTKCGNAACSSGNTATAVETTNNVGIYISIAIGADGLPVISHTDVTNVDLRVVKCGNAACSSGNTATAVDTANSVGYATSIAVGTDGLPVISYRDATNGDLRVTKCSDPTCKNTTGSSLSAGSDLGSRQYYFKNVYAAQYWGRQFQVADFADLAENYQSDEPLPPGTLVSVAPSVSIAVDGTVIPKVLPSVSGEGLLGVVSTNPAITLASEWGNTPIALAGRVPVRVSAENGPIRTGDPITASSVPGVGMKATHSGRIVGIALEAFDPPSRKATAGEGEGKILVAVQPRSYAAPGESALARLASSFTTERIERVLERLGIFVNEGSIRLTSLRAETATFDYLELPDGRGGVACNFIERGELVVESGPCR